MLYGVTRFSLFTPGSNNWKASKYKDENEYISYLFSKERLNCRFDILENHTLPNLDASTNKAGIYYKHLFLVSEKLPEWAMTRLKNLAEIYDFMVVTQGGVGDAYIHALNYAKEDLYRYKNKIIPFGVFLLDDDDVLPNDYLDMMQQYINLGDVGRVISMPLGYTAIFNNGTYSNFRKSYYPKLNIGMMSVCIYNGVTDGITYPIRGEHTKIDYNSPVIMDSRQPAYIWSRHIEQDTFIGNEHHGLSKLQKELDKYIELNCIDIAEISNRFNIKIGLEGCIITPEFYYIESQQNGNVCINYIVESDGCQTNNAALFTFIFKEKVTENISGLTLSPNSNIGIYKYLQTKQGTNKESINFKVPEGNTLLKVGLARWGNNTGTIRIEKLSITKK